MYGLEYFSKQSNKNKKIQYYRYDTNIINFIFEFEIFDSQIDIHAHVARPNLFRKLSEHQ